MLPSTSAVPFDLTTTGKVRHPLWYVPIYQRPVVRKILTDIAFVCLQTNLELLELRNLSYNSILIPHIPWEKNIHPRLVRTNPGFTTLYSHVYPRGGNRKIGWFSPTGIHFRERTSSTFETSQGLVGGTALVLRNATKSCHRNLFDTLLS